MNADDASAAVIAALSTGSYAFIDAGCGEGDSTEHLLRRFGRGPGLGLDYHPPAVEAARRRGCEALYCNLLADDLVLPPGCVEFSAAIDVLEHLPGHNDAAAVLRKLATASRDFLFVRHPSFEDVAYLADHGLKLCWTDWTCHPNRMTLADFRRVFVELGWPEFVIVPHMAYADSSHPSMLPLDAPADTLRYDPALHGPKPSVVFDRPVPGKFDIFVRLGRIAPPRWRSIARVEGWEATWDLGAPAAPVGRCSMSQPSEVPPRQGDATAERTSELLSAIDRLLAEIGSLHAVVAEQRSAVTLPGELERLAAELAERVEELEADNDELRRENDYLLATHDQVAAALASAAGSPAATPATTAELPPPLTAGPAPEVVAPPSRRPVHDERPLDYPHLLQRLAWAESEVADLRRVEKTRAWQLLHLYWSWVRRLRRFSRRN